MDWIFVNPDSIRLAKNIRVPSPLRRSYDCACVCQELKHSAACGQCPLAFVTPEELEKHQGRNANISISYNCSDLAPRAVDPALRSTGSAIQQAGIDAGVSELSCQSHSDPFRARKFVFLTEEMLYV